ncbi:carbon-nitrogen hydrolase [Methylomarinum vadi]|uniref:carbon-nitrogen hydrolase n=1 Tax=Methylomarinum vadi TaxID=438855 RepID=UPI0004DFBC60|nr:carbon-nitrogen hydrolase [Methylomarinum vadi]
MSKRLKVAAIQQPCGLDRESNLNYSIQQITQAAEQGVDLAVLPELHLGPYFCQTEDTEVFKQAQPIPGPTTEILSRVAKDNSIVIVSTIFEQRAPGLYHNTAVVFDKDGDIAGKYRKMHIPDDPGYYEKFYFTPGDLGFKPINTSIGKLGVLICWDQWYPEAARLMALAGAEILIYPTAIGWDSNDSNEEKQRQKNAWITVQRGHAVANGLPVISCNRIGFEPSPDNNGGIEFWGYSFIAGPQGEILSDADDKQDTILIYDLDMERSTAVRNIWPFLRDRRIDEFADLSRRFID